MGPKDSTNIGSLRQCGLCGSLYVAMLTSVILLLLNALQGPELPSAKALAGGGQWVSLTSTPKLQKRMTKPLKRAQQSLMLHTFGDMPRLRDATNCTHIRKWELCKNYSRKCRRPVLGYVPVICLTVYQLESPGKKQPIQQSP